MKKFEYATKKFYCKGLFTPKINDSDFDDFVNGLGACGWELVSCSPIAAGYGHTEFLLLIFKREIEE